MLLAIAGIAVFYIQSLSALMGLLGLTLLLFKIANLSLKLIWQQFRPILPLLMSLLVIQGMVQSWHLAVVVVLRLLVLMLLASLVTFTTKMSDMIATLECSLQPLARFGVQPARVSMMLAIAIRFVPVLLEQAHAIREAQWARGLDRNGLALLVPLLIKTLKMADDLTDALDARCYDDDLP
jgi:biotin transport system permease protein